MAKKEDEKDLIPKDFDPFDPSLSFCYRIEKRKQIPPLKKIVYSGISHLVPTETIIDTGYLIIEGSTERYINKDDTKSDRTQGFLPYQYHETLEAALYQALELHLKADCHSPRCGWTQVYPPPK